MMCSLAMGSRVVFWTFLATFALTFPPRSTAPTMGVLFARAVARLLASVPFATGEVPLAAVLSLVHFDFALERSGVLFEESPNLLEHPPRRFVGDAKLAL